MDSRFLSFLNISRWMSALVVVIYHVRFLLFIDYGMVHNKTVLNKAFYFVTGLGHEGFTVFFVANGILAGALLLENSRQHRHLTMKDILASVGRSYVMLVPVIILGGILDLFGATLLNGSGLYSDFPAFTTVTLSLSSFFGNLFMLQPFVVPTLGSNAMLYLLSDLWWSLCLTAVLFIVARWRKPLGLVVGGALLLVVMAIAPSHFILWLAIWLLGIGVVLVCARGPASMPVLVGWCMFGAALLFSRLVGSKGGLLPQPFGTFLLSWKYWFVGVGFATLALSLYRPASASAGLPEPASGAALLNQRLGEFAPLTFFFHFPIMMLMVGLGADVLHYHLMQQPGTALYLRFASVVAVSYGLTYFIGQQLERMTISRRRALVLARPQAKAVQTPGTRPL